MTWWQIAGALGEFMTFHGSERLVVERSEPEGLAALLLDRSELAA